jgi:hypothetical protein
MVRKGTDDTRQMNLDLPVQLHADLRDFAEKDQRTLKQEVIRALELLIATQAGAATTFSGSATVAEPAEERQLRRLDDAALKKLTAALFNFPESEEYLLIALMARRGWSRKTIATLLGRYEQHISNVLKMAAQLVSGQDKP